MLRRALHLLFLVAAGAHASDGGVVLPRPVPTLRIDEFLSGCARPSAGFAPRVTVGERVVAPTRGTVTRVEEDLVELSVCFVENHEVRRATLTVAGLEQVAVARGAQVEAGQLLGRGRGVGATVDGVEFSRFAAGREVLLVPRAEARLVVVDVGNHVAALFEQGALRATWELGHGQAEGVKELRGDLKTPRGLYFVTDKTRGPFGGDWGGYYGGVWVKVNYPNPFDAARGLDAGVLSAAEARDIAQAWQRRALTPQKTRLGGGIGFHGWIAPWDGPDGGYGLSWGCLVLHPEEARTFFDAVPVGTPVVLR